MTEIEEESKTSSLADSLKVSAEDKTPKLSGSEIDKLDPDELLVLLKKRKDQYWNLANYINKELLKHLDGNVNYHNNEFLNFSCRKRILKKLIYKVV